MRCPKCGAKLPTDSLYCEACGEDIHMVPDYDPALDEEAGVDLAKIDEQMRSSKQEIWQKEREKRARKRRVRGLGIFLAVLGAALVVLIITSSVVFYRLDSVEYQLKQAEKHKVLGEYDKAAFYYLRAIELSGEDIELLEDLANMYFVQNLMQEYEDTLGKLLGQEDLSADRRRTVYDRMIALMIKRGEFEEICNLLLESGDEKLLEDYARYLAREPVLDLESGEYEKLQSLRMTAGENGTIYYTTNGTTPNEKSTPYTVPIILDYGNVTVKACFINEFGVKSPVVVAEYHIVRPLENYR